VGGEEGGGWGGVGVVGGGGGLSVRIVGSMDVPMWDGVWCFGGEQAGWNVVGREHTGTGGAKRLGSPARGHFHRHLGSYSTPQRFGQAPSQEIEANLPIVNYPNW